MKHFDDALISAYIDGQLSSGAQREFWQHQRECARCAGRLRAMQRVHDQLNEGFQGHGWLRFDDFSARLPGILSLARGQSQIWWSRLILSAVALIVVLGALPVVPRSATTRIDIEIPRLNDPITTLMPQQRQTDAAFPLRQTLQTSLNLKYASPVPQPYATVESSPNPGR